MKVLLCVVLTLCLGVVIADLTTEKNAATVRKQALIGATVTAGRIRDPRTYVLHELINVNDALLNFITAAEVSNQYTLTVVVLRNLAEQIRAKATTAYVSTKIFFSL
jgi:hypothetical protein